MEKLNGKIEALIAEYLNSEISEENLRTLEKFAKEQEVPLSELVNMYDTIDKLDVPELSEQMDEKFYKMLSHEKELINSKSGRWENIREKIIQIMSVPQVPRLAYGLILLLIGLLAGNILLPNRAYEQQISSMSTQMGEMRKLMVLSMLEDEQATDRIKAVSFVDDMNEVDTKVIDALFKTLNNDENVNVRLVSLETLTKFTNLAIVREELVKSLEQQESPIIILELAEILIQLQDKKSIKELKNLLKKEDLDPNLRFTIESGLKKVI